MTFYKSGGTAEAGPDETAESSSTFVQALRWMTVYESANAATPRNRIQRAVRRNGDLLGNSSALMATSVLTSVLGFAYWWLAARSFPARAVGAASAAVSATTLVSTLGMFGLGTLLISELPRAKTARGSLIATCVSVSAAVSSVGGLIYVALALFGVSGLRSSLGSTLGIVLLILTMALTGATLVLDDGLVGLLLGHLQLLRNAYFAVGKLIFLAILAWLPVRASGSAVLATWTAGIVLSWPLLGLSLRRRGLGPIRPGIRHLRGLGRHTLDHNLLNVALFLPRIALPLVVTAVVSIEANAAFYAAWMIMSFIFTIPGSVATTLFAIGGGDSAALRARVRVGLAVALGIGLPISAGIAIFAHPIMGLFGSAYASTAALPLQILMATFAFSVFRQFYVAIARVHRRVRRASFYAVLIGVAELSAAWIGGNEHGLVGVVAGLAGMIALEGTLMAPVVLRVVFATPKANSDPANIDAETTAHPTGDFGARADRAISTSDAETETLPRISDDETAVLARLSFLGDAAHTRMASDATLVLPRFASADTTVILRADFDQTEIIPRVSDGHGDLNSEDAVESRDKLPKP